MSPEVWLLLFEHIGNIDAVSIYNMTRKMIESRSGPDLSEQKKLTAE